MRIVIDIPEGLKKDFELEQWTALSCMEMKDALEKAVPLAKGHWIDVAGGCECSECGCLEAGYSNFCPDCGVKMGVEE